MFSSGQIRDEITLRASITKRSKSRTIPFANKLLRQKIYMIPSEGGVEFGFPDQNTIQGEMSLSGAAYGSPNLRAQYVGKFSGVFIGSSAC
jgi:hypothetical protein